MSSFFTIPAAQKKRKRIEAGEPPKKRAAVQKSAPEFKKLVRRPQRDEEISGSESEDDDGPRQDDEESLGDETSGDDEETAAEQRKRLAERYLENIRGEIEDEVGFNAEDIDRDLIAERLREDVAESRGRIYRTLAPELAFGEASHTAFRGNDSQTITSIATCPPYAYTVSKDMYLTKWRLQDLPQHQYPKKAKRAKKLAPPRTRPERIAFTKGDKRKAKDNSFLGHVDIILCVAASQDGKFVVTGGRDRKIVVWEAATLTPLRVFNQHRDAVTSIAFRRGTNQMFSASKDRTIKTWSLNELAYVETLFGHQDEVVDIAALAQERCVSVGGRDRTARVWKVAEESQLVFRGGGGEKKSRHSSSKPTALEGSIDRVACIDEEMFITGGDNGNLSLWVNHKKKPIHTLSLAHGVDPPMSPSEASAEIQPDPALVPAPQPRWITALATIPYSDVILSGSWDGQIRAWRVSEDRKKIEAVGTVGSIVTSPESNASPVAMELDTDSGVGGMSPSAKHESPEQPRVRGVINDISVFERGDRGKDGITIVLAVGKEHRFGRWQTKCGRNGAVVFEVPKVKTTKTSREE